MITITDLDYRIGSKPILHDINLELAPPAASSPSSAPTARAKAPCSHSSPA